MQSWFLHVDMDAFFASVEQLDFPQYRGKPVIVGGFPSDRRSVVSTCSYEARKYGVHSAMPIAQAYRLCPHAVYLRGRMKRYQEKSREVMTVLADFSPDVRQMSIDEAFVDITGTERLFGPPEQTAKLLKKKVFEYTGLTVSVGLAPTKYLAKISSGMSKPDGFFYVPLGEEESFMLSLPLKKIWGIGSKTLTRLNEAGLFTTRDVHAVSKNALETLFGQATGTFLHAVVRGLETETFSEHTKSRSISSETTFSFDLTDVYTIETQLMLLSQDVMFRAINENLSSKTVHVKIRYEDFTTVNIQETAKDSITTANELHEKAFNLFRKKYESGRGIRLLGVGLQNIEEGRIQQGDLFESKNRKQEQLEKTLIELRKKHPQTTVQKARLLKPEIIEKKYPLNSIIFLLASALYFAAAPVNAQINAKVSLPEMPAALEKEAPMSLFQVTKDDTSVEFLGSGSWESKLSASATFIFEKDKPVSFKLDPVIFSQKADLSLWFLLNRQWYFEANFVDGYNKNSIAAGYYGNGVLKHARVGNSGIMFPEHYDTLIGTGNVISPGIMTDFSGEKWAANLALRYDTAGTGEKIFSGSNELSTQAVPLNRWVRGLRFALPSSTIAADIKEIFVEDDKSAYAVYTDSEGRKYRKLQASEYFIQPAQALLTLNTAVYGRIAVSFFNSSKTELQTQLGAGFGTTALPADGFLGAIQKFFGSDAGELPELWKYSYADSQTSSDSFFMTISGTETMILFDYPLFSPFEIANHYNFGNSSGDLSVIYSASGTIVSQLRAIFTTGGAINDEFTENANYQKNIYAELYNTTFPAQAGTPALVSPSTRYPAANTSPYAYLQPDSPAPAPDDIAIRAENYTPIVGYLISTSAIPGTIRVYRNGLLDNAYTFKPLTGEIVFHTQPSVFDTIRVTWLENDSMAKNASLAAAVGFTYDILPELRFFTSIATRWSFSDEKFSDAASSLPGTAEAAATIKWEKENLLLSNTVKGVIEVQDVTGSYRILGMDDSQPRYMYLLENSPVSLPQGISPVLNISGTPPVSLNYADKRPMRTSAIIGTKYGIAGYAAEMNWNFTENNTWSAQTLDLGGAVSELQSAQQFSLLLKKETAVGTTADYSVYLQLGVSAKTDFTYENTASIRTWDITDQITSTAALQPVVITLSDADRSLLSVNQNARIVIVSKTAANISGTVTAGYARLNGLSFAQSAGDPVIVEQTLPPVPLPQAALFNKNKTNSVLRLSWNDLTAKGFAEITRFIPPLPMSSYKTLNFYVLVKETTAPKNTKITVEFLRRTENSINPETVIKHTINRDELTAGLWQLVSIPVPYIDDDENSPTQIVIRLDKEGSPSEGEIFIDEFFLDGMVPQYRFQNTTEFKWKTDATLLSAKNFPLVAKPHVTVKGTFSLTSRNEILKTGVDARAEAGISLLKTDVSGFIYKDGKKDRIFASAGHTVKSDWPIFNISEQYVFNTDSIGTQKKDTAGFNAKILGQPFLLTFTTEGSFISNYAKQNAVIKLDAAFPIASALYSIRSELQAEQLNPDSSKAGKYNYGTAWTDISLVQFSTGYESAQNRKTSASLFQSVKFPFAGFLPSVQLDAKTRYTATSEILHNDYSSVDFEFPFIIGQNQFRFYWIKGGGAEKPVAAGGSYLTDAQEYASSAGKQLWLYTSLPFVDLFSPQIPESMQKAAQTEQSLKNAALLYDTLYGFSFQKPAFFSLADLFVPAKVNAQFGKEIRASSGDISEKYRSKLEWSMSAYNILGKFSKKPVFNWYEQDEIIQSYNIGIINGNNIAETIKVTAGAYISALLYFNERDFFKTENSFQFQSDNKWKLLNSLQINYGGKKSFISALALLIKPSLAETNTLIVTRKDTLTYSAAKNDEYHHEISASHNMTTSFNSIFSLSAEAGLILIIEEKKVTLQPVVSLSGKLTF